MPKKAKTISDKGVMGESKMTGNWRDRTATSFECRSSRRPAAAAWW